eukprot:2425996-Prymnesium_polylepis.1
MASICERRSAAPALPPVVRELPQAPPTIRHIALLRRERRLRATADDFFYVNYTAAYLTGDAKSAEYYAYARWAQTTVYAIFDRVLDTSAPKLILNGGGAGKDGGVFGFEWAEANFPAFYVKRGQEGHQFQSAGERGRLQFYSHKDAPGEKWRGCASTRRVLQRGVLGGRRGQPLGSHTGKSKF